MNSATEAPLAAMILATSPTVSLPRPTSTRTPTIRRTIFQRKCEPCMRMKMSDPLSKTSTASTLTLVDSSGFFGSAWANAEKS